MTHDTNRPLEFQNFCDSSSIVSWSFVQIFFGAWSLLISKTAFWKFNIYLVDSWRKKILFFFQMFCTTRTALLRKIHRKTFDENTWLLVLKFWLKQWRLSQLWSDFFCNIKEKLRREDPFVTWKPFGYGVLKLIRFEDIKTSYKPNKKLITVLKKSIKSTEIFCLSAFLSVENISNKDGRH